MLMPASPVTVTIQMQRCEACRVFTAGPPWLIRRGPKGDADRLLAMLGEGPCARRP